MERRKKNWSQTILGPKCLDLNQFGVQFGREKDFCLKKSLKDFGCQENFLYKNIGEEKLSPGQMLQGQMSL